MRRRTGSSASAMWASSRGAPTSWRARTITVTERDGPTRGLKPPRYGQRYVKPPRQNWTDMRVPLAAPAGAIAILLIAASGADAQSPRDHVRLKRDGATPVT